MGSAEVIEIPIDKQKVMLLALVQIIMGFIGYWLLQNYSTFDNNLRYFTLPCGIVFIITAPLFVIFFIYKFFDKSPGFIISNEGITDNSSMTSHGFIPWSEIAEIGEKQIVLRSCITLLLKNQQGYIDNASSGYKRMSWNSTYKRYGVDAIITSGILKCSSTKLFVMLKTGLENYNKGK
jgi:hypothetical protein